MDRNDEIKRVIELKRQAMTVLESAHQNRMAELASDIKSLRIRLREMRNDAEIDLETPTKQSGSGRVRAERLFNQAGDRQSHSGDAYPY